MRSTLAFTFLAFTSSAALTADSRPPVDFNRDIRPILSDTCFKCHGFDEATREAGLRLDVREDAIAELDSGEHAIVPGDPDASSLIARILSDDPSLRMPPEETGKKLTAEQIDLLRRWVEEGAEWKEHWSFLPPQAAVPTQVQNEGWVRNDIDRFIARRLEQGQLSPAPEADRQTLIRRVTLDLTGLPPTPEEVDAFVNDPSPDAYDKLVDRLLHSPHYGERMALDWMDVARYADTHGYVTDSERFMWRWRDWVIDAFNDNMPFDQFSIEQLAGDLLPNPTLDQMIASGFNRNHVTNSELGAIEAEYLVENISDRVNTTGTVWMGLTMQCARCHDHKFDPIKQKEFFELYAFFDHIGERGLDGMFSNAAPALSAPTRDQSLQMESLTRELADAQEVMTLLNPKIAEAREKWEASLNIPEIEDVQDGLIARWPLDGNSRDVIGEHHGNKKVLADGPFSESVFDKGMFFFGLNNIKVESQDAVDLEWTSPFTMTAWLNLRDISGQRSMFTRMPWGIDYGRGYAMQMRDGAVSLILMQDQDHFLHVESDGRVQQSEWHHVAASYDGSGKAAGVRLYLDGVPQQLRVVSDTLSDDGTILVDEPLFLGEGAPNAIVKGQLDEMRIYGRVLDESEIQRLPGIDLNTFLALPKKQRTTEASRRIVEAYLDAAAPSEWNAAYHRLAELKLSKAALEQAIPTVMVMGETAPVEGAAILMGGAYDRPGEKVSPDTPGFLPPMASELQKNRLGLARWLFADDHPLTARVTVNRYWQMYFGTGLVKTAEDFGVQGERPTHPELLDWLALWFRDSGWNVRELQRLIVTSAAYRQASPASADLWQRDPENRLLARGPRFRMNAEFIRDQALSVSGLMVSSIGGPSVRPYQPFGIWKEGAIDPTGNKWSAQRYSQGSGSDLYRRSMYTFWKRTAPPPSMVVFDAPERERCTVKRNRSNTPLQALVTMNDPTFVEASRKLAERMIKEGGDTPEERIEFAFRLISARTPVAKETATLTQLLEKQQARFADEPEMATALLSVGESPCDASLNPVDLAAYTTVGNVLLNLDETLMKY